MAVGKTLVLNEQGLPSYINKMAGWGLAAARPATGDVLAGSFYFSTDTKVLEQEQDGTWVSVLEIKTLNPANETVEAGYYAATTLHAVDADLAVANIRKAKVIFGFTGTCRSVVDEAANALLAMFQTWAAVGDFNSTPENINDNDTGAGSVANATAINQYAEVAFGDLVTIKRWRQFGDASNNGDGVWRIDYWNIETDAWAEWKAGIATRDTADWSGYSTEAEVITTKIRLVCTTVDTIGWSYIRELEVIF